ncbi:MAG: hypothetical protein ABWY29_04485 [Blastococcus sp.]
MTDIPDDDLRARLSRLDPAPAGVPVDPVTSPRAQELVERAMSTPVQIPDTLSAPDELSRRRRPWLLVAAAAAVLVALVGGFLVLGNGGPGSDDGGGQPSTLALELPPGDAAMSCIRFDVQILRDMPVALAGTVTALDLDQVSLDVDRWYRGGTADRVTIAVPVNNSAALDGVDFRAGERYLLTATDGTVNGCGFSGPASAELERAYAEAFGG